MIYETTESFRGEPRRAMEIIGSALTTAGLRIESRTDSSLHVTGPRWFVRGGKGNTLGAVTDLEVSVAAGSLSARADLSLVDRALLLAGGFVTIFLILLALLAVYIPFGRSLPIRLLMMDGPMMLAGLLPLPLARKLAQRRIRRAIETLLHNAAAMSS
jgi:hypothetical protein